MQAVLLCAFFGMHEPLRWYMYSNSALRVIQKLKSWLLYLSEVFGKVFLCWASTYAFFFLDRNLIHFYFTFIISFKTMFKETQPFSQTSLTVTYFALFSVYSFKIRIELLFFKKRQTECWNVNYIYPQVLVKIWKRCKRTLQDWNDKRNSWPLDSLENLTYNIKCFGRSFHTKCYSLQLFLL